jgi:hypothetical protein
MIRKGAEDLSTQEEEEKSSFSGSSHHHDAGTKDSGEMNGEYSGTSRDESVSSDDNLVFGKKENSRVQRSKMFLLAVVFLAAVGACLAVYFVMDSNETDEYNAAYVN